MQNNFESRKALIVYNSKGEYTDEIIKYMIKINNFILLKRLYIFYLFPSPNIVQTV